MGVHGGGCLLMSWCGAEKPREEVHPQEYFGSSDLIRPAEGGPVKRKGLASGFVTGTGPFRETQDKCRSRTQSGLTPDPGP